MELAIKVDDKDPTRRDLVGVICGYGWWGMWIEFTPEEDNHR